MTYTVRPISDRTMFKGKHRLSPFDAAWSSTEDLLERELRALGARNVVLEMDVTEADIRNDGKIRANARPSSSAVRVAFDSYHGPLVYATDRFYGWQANVRAIALGMEALRKIERYGIANRDEQYAGFKALPAGRSMPPSHLTRDEALRQIADIITSTGPTTCYPADVDGAIKTGNWGLYRKRLILAAHPDHRAGDRALWDKIEEAALVLGVAS